MSNKEAIGLTVCQSSKHKYRIGFEIGSGSCATVHELDAVLSESSPSKNNLEKRTIATQFVIKLAPTGKSKTSTQTGKPKRKKKTTAERKADLLYYEYGLYRNTFGLVLGSLMPNLPDTLDKSQPPDYGEVEGFRFLVMERMSAPLSDVAAYIRENTSLRAKLVLGAVAVKMLSCLETMHRKKFVCVDVKMENFMLSQNLPSSRGTATTTIQMIADSIRLLDLGLAESYHDVKANAHRDDAFPNGPMVGTPLYASRNVLAGHTVSRRDDLESLGFVLADMVLLSCYVGKVFPKSALPWRQGKSDDDILRLMRIAIEETDGLYVGMGASDGKIMKEYLRLVRALSFDDTPKYDELRSLLSKLCGGSIIAAKMPKETLSGKKRAIDKANAQEIKPAQSKAKTKARKTTKKAGPASDAVIVEQNGSAENSNVSISATNRGPIEMDWEPLDSANEKKNAAVAVNEENGANIKCPCLKLLFINGPGKDTEFKLYAGSIITAGSNPGNTRPSRTCRSVADDRVQILPMPFDDAVSVNHAKLEVFSRKKTHSIKISDLRSATGTFVNGKQLASGASRQVFRGDRITLGRSTILVTEA